MNEKEKVLTHLDIPYSYELAKRMEMYRCNPVLGYRSAGSKAEFLTGEMLKKEMEEIGLSEVTKDEITVDGWEFRKAQPVRNLLDAPTTGEQFKFDKGRELHYIADVVLKRFTKQENYHEDSDDPRPRRPDPAAVCRSRRHPGGCRCDQTADSDQEDSRRRQTQQGTLVAGGKAELLFVPLQAGYGRME